MDRLRRINVVVLAIVISFVSFSSALADKEEKKTVKVLVISSRNYPSMQPQVYYAFKDAARKIDPAIALKFVMFNPFFSELTEEGPRFEKVLNNLMNILNECVPEVVAIKRAEPEIENLLNNIHAYIKKHPESHLSRFHKEIERLMNDFEFLVIESSDTYGVHPIFYLPYVTEIDTPDGAERGDLIEALYGMFFLDAAFKQGKPAWGTCHGAHVGYVHAGGKLSRLFDYKEGGHDVDFKNNGQNPDEVEVWHIGRWLYTHKKDTDYREYGSTIYPLPEIFRDGEKKSEEMYMNKDFEHSLAMTSPVPENIKIISYHPLSEYQERKVGEKYDESNKEFKKILKNQVIIDAYKYKTMLGTQYHPQFTYNDLETSNLFEYLIRQLTANKSIAEIKQNN